MDKEEMMGYKSPITLLVTEAADKFNSFVEDKVLETVRKVGVDVNREELEKALKYDRNQYKIGYSNGYSTGYEEGKREAAKEILQALYNHTFELVDPYSDDDECFGSIDRDDLIYTAKEYGVEIEKNEKTCV